MFLEIFHHLILTTLYSGNASIAGRARKRRFGNSLTCKRYHTVRNHIPGRIILTPPKAVPSLSASGRCRGFGEPSEMKKILHVDDEKDIRAVAKLALQSVGGFDLTSCASGQEALDCVAEIAPDLIMLDVMMPGMDGPSTLIELRKREDVAEVPIVFMTAKTQQDEIRSLLDIGAIGVIAKPFDPMKLSEEVRKVWSTLKENEGKD
jgi:CheY-like chemotaxis protein